MTQKEKDLQVCGWKVRLYDERRNDNTISEKQREIAEKWYKIYYRLYNKMYKQLKSEEK
jgi:hypothetical protein